MAEAIEATSVLVAARTDGLRIRSRDGDGLGHIHAFMVEKASGQTAYAVLSLGGLLGMGESYYPVPISLLNYDVANDDYVVTIDRRQLEGGPSWSNNTPAFDRAYADRVSSYYGIA